MPCNDSGMTHVELPKPWVRDQPLDTAEADQLEALIGSRLTFDDLLPEDTSGDATFRALVTPKAWAVIGRRWTAIRNTETGARVLLRLQRGADGDVAITSVVVPWDAGRVLAGVDLRDVPVAALAAAFTADEHQGQAQMRRSIALTGEGDLPDPLDPLPEADRSPRFLALVARQYEALEATSGPGGVVDALATLNGKPLSTVRRWIAQARKQRLLAPAMPVRGK